MTNRKSTTVLGDFERTIRDEPLFYIYKHRVYVTKDEVDPQEVTAWLRERYVTKPRGHRYRVVTYLHANGNRYVDYVLLETCTDADLIYMKMRWGWTEVKVQRGEKVKRKRLNKEQAAYLKARIAQVRQEYLDSIGA